MKQSKNNFSAGLVDEILAGQPENPIAANGLLSSMNFLPLPGGGITRRPGLFGYYENDTYSLKEYGVSGLALSPGNGLAISIAGYVHTWNNKATSGEKGIGCEPLDKSSAFSERQFPNSLVEIPWKATKVFYDKKSGFMVYPTGTNGSIMTDYNTSHKLVTQRPGTLAQYEFFKSPLDDPPFWSAQAYAINTRIYYGPSGRVYKSNAATAGTDVPGISAKWALDETGTVSSQVLQPFAKPWSAKEQYVVGDVVYYAAGTAATPWLYRCWKLPAVANVPTDTAYWDAISTLPTFNMTSGQVRDIEMFQSRLWILGDGVVVGSRVESIFDLIPSGDDMDGAISINVPQDAHSIMATDEALLVFCKDKEMAIVSTTGAISAAPGGAVIKTISTVGTVRQAASCKYNGSIIYFTTKGFYIFNLDGAKSLGTHSIQKFYIGRQQYTYALGQKTWFPVDMIYDIGSGFIEITEWETGPMPYGDIVPPYDLCKYLCKIEDGIMAVYPVFTMFKGPYAYEPLGVATGQFPFPWAIGRGSGVYFLHESKVHEYKGIYRQETTALDFYTYHINAGAAPELSKPNAYLQNKQVVLHRSQYLKNGPDILSTQTADSQGRVTVPQLVASDTDTYTFIGILSKAYFKTTPFGISPGLTVSVKKVILNLYNSKGGKVRIGSGAWEPIDYSKLTRGANGLYSGFVEIYVQDSLDMAQAGKTVEVDCSDSPYPFTCLGITAEMIGGDQ